MLSSGEAIYHSDLAIPPGEFLEEILDDLGMSKTELAQRMERPASKLSAIFQGEKAITPDTALCLETVVGVPAHIWTGLEAEYQLTLERQKQVEREGKLKAEVPLVSRFQYAELARLGEVAKRTKPIDKVRELHKFFGTMSLFTIAQTKRYQPAFRLGQSGQRIPEALASWLRMGERRAGQIDCKPFNKNGLRSVLSDIRAMTLQSPNTFQPRLTSLLAEHGVALVVCPHLKKTCAHGATFRIHDQKVVTMITLRGAWADIFWFTLFHEIGHILKHSLTHTIIEDNQSNEKENEANAFARDILIPPDEYALFIQNNRFAKDDICRFADEIGIHPGIVAGRLQHDALIKQNWHQKLRQTYSWTAS